MGWENIFQVEIDKYCQKVLAKNFPNVKKYTDIKNFSGYPYRGAIDIITGGFPCQPFSVAGKREGKDDDRALWHEMYRSIREIRPPWVIAENVPGLLTIERGMVFEQVCTDLENEGYQVQPFILPACGVNAPHKRDRIWFVGNNTNARCFTKGSEKSRFGSWQQEGGEKRKPTGEGNGLTDFFSNTASQGLQESKQGELQHSLFDAQRTDTFITDSTGERLEGSIKANVSERKKRDDQLFNGCDRKWEQSWYEVATEFCRVDARIPNRVDRLKSLGNAIVPEVAYQLFKALPL